MSLVCRPTRRRPGQGWTPLRDQTAFPTRREGILDKDGRPSVAKPHLPPDEKASWTRMDATPWPIHTELRRGEGAVTSHFIIILRFEAAASQSAVQYPPPLLAGSLLFFERAEGAEGAERIFRERRSGCIPPTAFSHLAPPPAAVTGVMVVVTGFGMGSGQTEFFAEGPRIRYMFRDFALSAYVLPYFDICCIVLPNVVTCCRILLTFSRHFRDNPVCPDPVRKPSTRASLETAAEEL